MVGFCIRSIVRSIAASARASRKFSSTEYPAARRIQFRSAPAEKLFPLPPSTTMRVPGSRSSARKAAVKSAISLSSKALWRSGRFIQTVVTAPRRSTSSVS